MSPDRKEPTAEERTQFFNLKAMKEDSLIFFMMGSATAFVNEVIYPKDDTFVNTPIDMLIAGSSVLGTKLVVHGIIEPAIRKTIRTIRKNKTQPTRE